MNIASKLTLGLVSVFFVGAVAFASTVHAEEIEALQARLNALLAQLAALEGGSAATTTTTSSSSVGSVAVSAGSNAGCFTSTGERVQWSRNLSQGSTGNDVYQLQKFLNEVYRLQNDPRARVAVSGAGSPGRETSYYGPATATAVSGFQEIYKDQILTPLGLTSGTGGFYTSTRRQANGLCNAASAGTTTTTTTTTGGYTPTQPTGTVPTVTVTGSELAVTPGTRIPDAYAVQGAQRVPYTSFVLTAGSSNVRVDGIQIKKFGLSSRDNFGSIALVDVNNVQIGSARKLNSRNEVKLGSNLVIPRNRSVTLTVVANVADDADGGAVGGLMIESVSADVRVSGAFPVRGAAHAFSEALDLQKAVVEVSGGGEDIEFNEETEVATVDVSLTTSNDYFSDTSASPDEEDAYLRSITLEQVGSARDEELGDMTVLVDGDRADYKLSVDGDRYIINFDGKGVLIKEGDSVQVSLETETNTGYKETVQFKLDDTSDVYVVGADYGYGLPVCFEGDKQRDNANKDDRCNGKDDTNGSDSEGWMTTFDSDGDVDRCRC